MVAKSEKYEEKPVATAFENVSAPAINHGEATATVSGKLIRKDSKEPIENAEVAISVAGHPSIVAYSTTDASGRFSAALDTSNLDAQDHTIEAKYNGDTGNNLDATSGKSSLTVSPADAAASGEATGAPRAGRPGGQQGKGCNSPGTLITAVNRVLRDPRVTAGVSELLREAAAGGTSTDEHRKKALGNIARAFEGTDAVPSKGEPCRGQCKVEVYMNDAVTGKRELVSPDLLRLIDAQLIDDNFNLATSRRTYESDGILFSEVEAHTVHVALSSEIVQGAELSSEYSVTEPGQKHFRHFRRQVTKQVTTTQSTVVKTTSSNSQSTVQRPSEELTQGYRAQIRGGMETQMQLVLNPPPAFVRCFSCLEGELDTCSCASCAQGNPCAQSSSSAECRYVSRVSINAMRGEKLVACNPTGTDGCAGFPLTPGWYDFSAPEDITIEGCNYTLSSSSPVSAYVGAGQKCSDVVFCYKKKGSEILVASVVSHAEIGDPEETATENLPGVQYLLLRENDSTFSQGQLSVNGEAVRFRNLCAGTYWLFCQAPATFASLPIRPVFPPQGRITLSVFAGQVGAIPVYPRFQTSTTSSAVLDGHVRDESGFAMPQQIVQIVNSAGYVIAAALTDANGYYSVRVYQAEDLQIKVGTQTRPVAKSQIQAQIHQTSPEPVAFSKRTISQAVQASQLLGV